MNSHDIEYAEKFLADHPDLQVVEVLLVDINGVHRGKWIPHGVSLPRGEDDDARAPALREASRYQLEEKTGMGEGRARGQGGGARDLALKLMCVK